MISGLILLIECFLLNLMQLQGDSFIVIFMIISFSIGYIFDLQINNQLKKVSGALCLGYFLRLFLLFFDRYGQMIFSLPNSGADSEVFYQQGIMYAKSAYIGASSMAKMTGIMFRFLGESRLFVQFLLMLFSVVALHMAAEIFRVLSIDEKVQKHTMYVLCLLPNFAIISSLFLRESVVAMFASISLFFFIRWFKGATYVNLFASFIAIFCGSIFHSGIVGMALGYIIVLAMYDRKSQKLRMSIGAILSALFFLFVFVYLFNNYSEVFFGKMLGLNSVGDIANKNASGGSSYAAYVGNSDTILNLIMYTPIRLFYFLLSPFVWQIRNVSDIIALLFNSFFYLYVLYKSIRCLQTQKCEKQTVILCLLIVGVATAFVYAWGVTNTGTAIRHRDKMAVLYGVLLALTGGLPFRIRLRR